LAIDQPKRGRRVALLGLLLLVTVVWSAAATQGTHAVLAIWGSWAITLGAMLLFLAAIGLQRVSTVAGVLVDNRNLMSLSRLQLTAWTVLVASALLTIGLARSFNPNVNVNEALDISIPKEVWELLGISGGSSILAAVVKKNKEGKEPPLAQSFATIGRLKGQRVYHNATGLLYRNERACDASLMDMFEGDELANTAYVDLSKVQLFLFTVVGILAYGTELFHLMDGADASMLTEFPAVTSTLVTILGLSHATYLGTKAIDKTRAAPTAPADTPPSPREETNK
jgi:hypothetical protein